MDDLKEYNPTKTKEKEKEPALVNKVNELYDAWSDSQKKEIKVPRKAKVNKGRKKKGWFGVIYINENGNVWGEKEKTDDFVFKERKAIRYHATDGREILFWMGKFPIIIQPTWKKNPLNIRQDQTEKNETYGQKYIMARMLADVIKVKTTSGKGLIWIIGAAIGAYLLYTIFTGGF